MKEIWGIDKTIDLSILYVHKKEVGKKDETVIITEIKQTYISKFSPTSENQVFLLKITDENSTWHYLAVPKCLHKLGKFVKFYCE